MYTEAYYSDGTISDVSCRYMVPMKKNEIRGYSERSYRVWAHDENLQPVWAGWHLENDAVACEINAWFSVSFSGCRLRAAAFFVFLDICGIIIQTEIRTSKKGKAQSCNPERLYKHTRCNHPRGGFLCIPIMTMQIW